VSTVRNSGRQQRTKHLLVSCVQGVRQLLFRLFERDQFDAELGPLGKSQTLAGGFACEDRRAFEGDPLFGCDGCEERMATFGGITTYRKNLALA
jgi:hypothetical protein